MGGPKAPQALPERQVAHSAPVDAQIGRSDQRERLRNGFARMIFSKAESMAAAPATTGKTLLGA